MSLTTQQLQNYAWMSQASYLGFTGLVRNKDVALIDKLKTSSINAANQFTGNQASLFTGANTQKRGRIYFN